MKIVLLAAAATSAALAALPAQATIGINSAATVYSQNFDSLATSGTTNAWVNDSSLTGWSLFNSASAAVTNYAAGNGSSNTGRIYSFGTDAERALGGVGSAGYSGWITAAFSNTSAVSFDSVTLAFDGEQWRNGGATSPAVSAAQTMVLEYGFGASFAGVALWTAPGGAFNWTSPVFGTNAAAAVDGNVVGRVGGLGGTLASSWVPGQTLWLRWIENNDPGNDHGLAIDNFNLSVTAVPEPETYALLLAGLGALGLMASRNRPGGHLR